jgi:hypothetical protein
MVMAYDKQMVVAIVRLRVAGVHQSWIDWAMTTGSPMFALEAWEHIMEEDSAFAHAAQRGLQEPRPEPTNRQR